jgi:hypothetical protein
LSGMARHLVEMNDARDEQINLPLKQWNVLRMC